MSEKFALSSDDFIKPPGTKAAIGSENVPELFRGIAASYCCAAGRMLMARSLLVGGLPLPLIWFMSAIVLGEVSKR